MDDLIKLPEIKKETTLSPEQEKYVIEAFRFTSCANWDTNACPHLHNAYMQLDSFKKLKRRSP